MFRGIFALFTTGLILQPMVLCGIVLGCFFYGFLSGNEIAAVYKSFWFYLAAMVPPTVYFLGFRRVYQTNGKTDWTETMLGLAAGWFKLVASSLLMIAFISFFDMGDVTTSDRDVEIGSQSF